MQKAGQSLIVETGVFEWPWHTPLGLAIIGGACGGGGGGGGAFCIEGRNLYGADGGDGGDGGQATTLQIRDRTYQASGGNGGGGGGGGGYVEGLPTDGMRGLGCHFGNGGTGGGGGTVSASPERIVSAGGNGGRGFPGETRIVELAELQVRDRFEIMIGEGGGGGGGGEGYKNGDPGTAGSNGFVRFVPLYSAREDA